MNHFQIVFICTFANYYWISESNLTNEEAERKSSIKNRYEKIHGSCCQFYVQPMQTNIIK